MTPDANIDFTEMRDRLESSLELRAKTDLQRSSFYEHLAVTGLGIFFSPQDAQGLENATPAQLSEIEISPSGFGLSFPKLDADIYVPALLEGSFGSRKWMAARLGAQGGKARSLAKRTAARANGALGGRPRKSATR
jgi:hypothetical protein